ncbi:MAG: hypothetical protein NWF00_04820 [Candidatus Bathyarchaeota archaeon]|nr:hypothetical protein [Candidatus Bathyarchaeota archaeon]
MTWSPEAFKYSPGDLKEEILIFVLKPLHQAYVLLAADPQVASYKEDKITKELIRNLKKKTSLCDAFNRHSIDVNLGSTELLDDGQSCRPDIKFTLPSRNWLHIEAKRIYRGRNWSINEYLGANGIGRILSGNYYSIDHPYAGMLCYVQNGQFERIIDKIKKGLISLVCKNLEDLTGVDNCALSKHVRTRNEVVIFHLFFHFTSQCK